MLQRFLIPTALYTARSGRRHAIVIGLSFLSILAALVSLLMWTNSSRKADWKTFQHEFYPIAFDYPPTAELTTVVDVFAEGWPPQKGYYLGVSAPEETTAFLTIDLAKLQQLDQPRLLSDYGEPKTLAGPNGIIYKRYERHTRRQVLPGRYVQDVDVLAERNGLYIMIQYIEPNPMAEALVSSFRFTSQEFDLEKIRSDADAYFRDLDTRHLDIRESTSEASS